MLHKLIYLCNQFPPIGGSGVQRQYYFCRYLPELGWQPFVLTVKAVAARTYDPTLLASLPTECRIRRTESLQFNRLIWLVTRILRWGQSLGKSKSDTAGDENKGFRFPPLLTKLNSQIRSWLIMPDEFILWLPFALVAGRRWVKEVQPRLILARAGPHSVNIVAYFLSRVTGLTYVLDWADPWTQRPYYHMPTRAHRWWNEYWEARVLKAAAHIIVICEQMRLDLTAKYPFIKEKISVITNGYDARVFDGLTPQPDLRTFVITYVGTLDLPRYEALETLCKAVDETGIGDRTKVKLVGRVDPDYDSLCQRYGFVDRVGYVPYQMAVQSLLDADLLLLCMQEIEPNIDNTITIPSKVFEYFASGTPILALGPDCDATRLIAQTNAGSVARPSDLELTKAHLVSFYQQWKAGGERRPPGPEIQKYERSALSQRLADILNEVVVASPQ